MQLALRFLELLEVRRRPLRVCFRDVTSGTLEGLWDLSRKMRHGSILSLCDLEATHSMALPSEPVFLCSELHKAFIFSSKMHKELQGLLPQ